MEGPRPQHDLVFALLDKVEKRPSRYLQAGDLQRGEQLRELSILLEGYALALFLHGIKGSIIDFRAAFADFLGEHRGWDTSFGAFEAVRAHAASDDEAWTLFFQLVHEFRDSK